MSSIVSVQCSQGFVISSDSIVFKYLADSTGNITGKVKGTTRKLFQISDDVITVGLGNWNSYFPMFNHVARMSGSNSALVNELRSRGKGLTDTRIYIFSKNQNGPTLDIVEGGQVRTDQSGAVMYPEPILNSMFLTLYESPSAQKIRSTGMLGIAALINAYNLFAASLCSDISAPFDTILFTNEGVFNLNGGTTKLPAGDFL
jgi:hypothetical protein